MEQNCAWSDIFEDQSRATLETGIVTIGAISALLGAWLNSALLFTNLRSDLSYRNLMFFTFIACIRRAASVFTHLPLNYSGSIDNANYKVSCDFFGFWDSFLAVYEVECLTHVCIERYVIAKYTTRGWSIEKNHYIMYQFLCIFFAALYSFPPLFGIGKYDLDFTCHSCVLDMILPSTWDRYIVVAIFLLRSVKSTGFMITMLIWARNLESRYDNSDKNLKEVKFTNSVITITIVNVVCWLPVAIIRGWVVFSYFLLSNDVQVSPSASSIQWAFWIHWMSPALTAIAMFMVDDRTHEKMINLWKSDDNREKIEKQE